MRGLVEGLPNPHAIVQFLPGLLQEDAFVQRLVAGLDDVLAPILLSLDNLDAYLDPATAPPDFLEWLGEWVGIAFDENWPLDQQRALVAGAVDLFHWRGTVRGLSAHVALYTGVEPDIEETGGCSWSPNPNSDLPGHAEPSLIIRVQLSNRNDVDVSRLNRIVSASKPAHIPHRVEILDG
jgi:phage tail-like protein